MRYKPHIKKMSEKDLRRMQMTSLEILLEVDRICRKCGISYNLCGGTLLGAVRHKGFIPWDDDVDISMARSEYKRFRLACADEMNPEKFFLQDFDSDPKYRWGYAKVLKANTVYIRTGQEHLGIKTGVFIDIFILDGIPNQRFLIPVHTFLCFCIRKILWSPVGAKVSRRPALRFWYRILSWIPRGLPVFLLSLLAACFPCDRCRLVRPLTFPMQNWLNSRWLTSHTQLEFEGYMLSVPEDYRDWLERVYGNYMELPPVEERKGNSPASYYQF